MVKVSECLRQAQLGEVLLVNIHYVQITKKPKGYTTFLIRCLKEGSIIVYCSGTYASTDIADVRYVENYLRMNRKQIVQVGIENYELPRLPPLQFQIDTVKFIDTFYHVPIGKYNYKICILQGLGKKEIKNRVTNSHSTTYRVSDFMESNSDTITDIITEINIKIDKGKIFNKESIFNIDESLFSPYYIEGYLYFKSLNYNDGTEIKLPDIQTQILLTAKLMEIHKKIIKCKEKKRQLKNNLRYLLNNVFPQIS